ncbi:MAG: peptidase M16 [Acidobacteria bacterium]|nr:MAG: peptidase M16 [Acidobacteriota bacterium]
MKKIMILLGIIGFITISAHAKEIDFVEYDLKNGLHVILHEDHSTPIVAVSIMYHVGAKNEDPDKTGFAHFFEHLLFEGSENIKRGEFDDYVNNAGGFNNANTTDDRTYYYEVLPSNYLELGLWLESERLLHAKILQEGVDTQREVVKEERRERMDNQPYGTILEELKKRAFKVHPYRWHTIGSMEHLNNAKLEHFIAFYKEFYVPNNAVLSIAGDIDIKQTKKLIKKYFKDIPRGEGEIYRPNIVEPPQKEEIRDIVYDNIQLPGVVQAYKMPAQGTPDYYSLKVLFSILSNGQSSRLNKVIKDQQQKAVMTGAFPLPTEDPGMAIMFAIASPGTTAEDLEAAIDKEVFALKDQLVPERELQKVKNQIEASFISQNNRVAGIAESLANYHMYFGDTNLINTEINRYLKVTAEDIQKVAKKYLVKNSRVVLYYLPKAMQEKKGESK